MKTSSPPLLFQQIILVEPMLSPSGYDHLMELRVALQRSALKRRNEWQNRETALQIMKQGERTKRWNERTREVFVVRIRIPSFTSLIEHTADFNGL